MDNAVMRYASKAGFVDRMEAEHNRFIELAGAIGRARFAEPGVWGEGWTIKDLFAHLTAWEQMFLDWHRVGLAGETPAMPAPGYRWNETPRLNRAIWAAYKDEPWGSVAATFDRSYDEICALVAELSEAELLEEGRFSWTGKHPLTTYLGANTASHYAAGSKILRRFARTKNRSTHPG